CDVYAVRSSLLLLLLLGPPPRSTLFPYTTLFRSDGDAQRYGGEHGGRQTEADAPEAGAQVLPEAGVHVAFAEQLPATGEHGLRRSEEHTSELQSRENLVCRLLLEKKKKDKTEHR